VITLTDNAAAALLDLVRDKDPSAGLRLAVEKGGCAGLQYAMSLGCLQPGDLEVSHKGARVFVEAGSVDYLADCTLDYDDGLAGAGFRIQNPRAARSCGCGTSFEPTDS